MNKRIAVIIIIILLLITCIYLLIHNSNCNYANKLISAIEKEDITEINRIITEKPDCINSRTGFFPDWLYNYVDRRTTYPLISACAKDNELIVKTLINHGANVNCNDGRTPLSITYCSKNDNWYQIAECLIENGASLDYTTEYSGGRPSVFCDIVQTRSGASFPDYIPENDALVSSAFFYAIQHCSRKQVDWARVLHECVSNDRIDIVSFLLDEGYCDVNDCSTGMTALMYAARDSSSEMVHLLLTYGADKTYYSTEDKKTALDYAIESNNTEAIPILTNN